MLHWISWSQYFTFIAVATSCYYFFVWFVYFKAKLPSISLSGLSRHGIDRPGPVMSTIQLVVEELQPVFENRQNKIELVMALQKGLRKYIHWDEPGFRESLNDFISAQSERVCSIHLSEEDFRVIWKG